MSRTESTSIITESIYREYRIRQDDAIKKALDKLHDNLAITFDNKLSTVHGALSGSLGELNNEMVRVKTDLQDLKDEVGQVKDEVGQVKDEVGQVKDEVGQVKDEVAKMQTRLNQMDGRSFNKSRNMPYHTIAVIGVYQDLIGLRLPVYFPSTILEFWKLRDPVARAKLAYLIRFYDIQNFQYWGQTHRNFTTAINAGDTSSIGSDSEDDASQQDSSLENAIKRYPDVALDELASCLGLPLDEIRNFFRRAAEYRQQQEQQQRPAIKRHATAAVNTDDVKRPKDFFEAQMSLQQLLKKPSAPSSSAQSSKILWDVSANNLALEAAIAKMKAAPNSPRESSDGSSTDIIPSQEVRDPWPSKKL